MPGGDTNHNKIIIYEHPSIHMILRAHGWSYSVINCKANQCCLEQIPAQESTHPLTSSPPVCFLKHPKWRRISRAKSRYTNREILRRLRRRRREPEQKPNPKLTSVRLGAEVSALGHRAPELAEVAGVPCQAEAARGMRDAILHALDNA